MDPDDEVIAALGALLTQLRSARRALEDVQRSTSRYGGFEFSNAFSRGDRFGAPPLFDGALMVHIVNINDLAPGNSFGGFLESLFGGIGNFFSNLIGGLVGSTVSAFKLPAMIAHLDSIVGTIERILIRLGIGQKKPDAKSNAQAQADSGESLLTTLEGIRQLVKDVTALFEVGAGKGSRNSAEKAAETSQRPITETGERWMAILNGVNVFLTRTQRLVDGLVLLIPMAIGGIAFLIANLGEVRRAILETIQFLLRNALVLRGVLLTVVFETVASAARLASAVAGIIGDTIKSVLSAIFAIIQKLLEAAFAALESLTDALQAIVKSVLTWLVEGLFTTLRAIGELKLFQTVDRLIRVLPALLSAIYMLKASKKLPDDIQGMLDAAHKSAFPDDKAAGTGGKAPDPKADVTTVVGNFPDLSKIFKPLGGSISGAITSTGATVAADVQVSFDDITTTLANVATRFDTAARNEAKFSSEVLDKYGTQIKSNADTLTKAITTPIEANAPSTGFELIAKTYEEWLTQGGLKTVLDGTKDYFKDSPKEAGEATGALRLLRGQFDRPRASIEIDEVEIILEPGEKPLRLTIPPPGEYGPGDYPVRTDEDVWVAYNRFDRQLTDRGIRPDQRDALVS